jgi:GNAT superfamily N-acetyltransferase
LRWSAIKEFWALFRSKPKLKEHYLEFVFLITDPEYQQKGFGRKVLRFIIEWTRTTKFKGILLCTTYDSPAYKLAFKEGFSVDTVFKLGDKEECWMRYISKE